MEQKRDQMNQAEVIPEIVTGSWSAVFKQLGKSITRVVKIAAVVAVSFSLSFHIMPEYEYRIFPKEQLSFAYTTISSADIEALIERYNTAGGIDRSLIKQEYIYKRLTDEGLIAPAAQDEE